MGYYVRTIEQDIFLPKVHFDAVYKEMCKLNDHDELKRGGGWGGIDSSITSQSPRPEGMNYHPAKWFSWMDANYPETCLSMEEVLTSLGFELRFDDEGNLIAMFYDNKTGQEELFIETMAPFMKDGSYIHWAGEDDYYWETRFESGAIIEKVGRIIYD